MRAVLDPNILISALLSRSGSPALIVSRWLAGEFELIVSEALLNELRRTLAYPKLQTRIRADESGEFLNLLRDTAVLIEDPTARRHRSPDPGDDYLLALAEAAQAVLVCGDQHVLELAGELPIRTARAFLETLDSR